MIFVDTGYFVALADQYDELHERAWAWARTVSDQLLTTEYVAWEVVNHFSSPADRPRAHEFLSPVRDRTAYEVIPATPAEFEAGIDLHARRPDKAWSLTDCISFRVMKRRRVRAVLAYDIHFVQAGFDALLRRDPK